MYNSITLVGNMGQDPEVKKLENGTSVCKISVATSETYKDANGQLKTETEWHDVVLWRHNADYAGSYAKKGSTVFVEGKLTKRKYQAQDGTDKYATEVVARQFKIFGSRDQSSDTPQTPQQVTPPTPTPTPRAAQIESTTTQTSERDDLPF